MPELAKSDAMEEGKPSPPVGDGSGGASDEGWDENRAKNGTAVPSGEGPAVETPDDEQRQSKPAAKKSLQDHSRKEYAYVVLMGICMAFSAGYSNGVAISGFIHIDTTAVKQSVAGVTGVYTKAAIAVGENDLGEYRFMVGTLFSVMAGSCITSVLNPRPVAFELSSRYAPAFLLGTLFMALGASATTHNYRREFYFTAIANGIQNACSSLYSANLIRTTHLTGTTTDIGLFVGQMLRGNYTNAWKLYILSGLATSFWIGSLGGYIASKHWRQHSLIFNAVFFFAIGCSLIGYFVVMHKVSLFEAVFGLGKWGIVFEKIEIRKKGDSGEEEKVSEEELMRVFDEIDVNHSGHIDQDQLLEVLSSRDVEIRRKRKSIVSIVHTIFHDHDKVGDWKVSREDWRRLVHDTVDAEGGGSSLRSKSLPPSMLLTGGPDDLRRASIAQLESAGLRASVPWNYTLPT